MDEEPRRGHQLVARNAGNSLELLLELLHQEAENFRGQVRRIGDGIRDFVGRHVSKRDAYAETLINFAARANPLSIEDVNHSPKLREKESYLQKNYTIPARTFADLSFVLLNDEEEGVASRLPVNNPKWPKLPDYTPAIPKEADPFQLWNRPMGSPCTMPTEDDDERLSLPSTKATDWNRDKIDSVEAQLALLTKQMQALLQLQHQNRATPLPMASSRSGSPLILSDTSEDEGRGASLRSGMHTPSRKIAAVAPPPGPPPPPPPPGIFSSVENKPVIIRKNSDKGPSSPEKPLPPRPTAADLMNVQLRKVARSPGGTPQVSSRRSPLEDSIDNSNILAAALMSRFRAMHNDSFTDDQQEPDDSWQDD